MTYDTFVKDMIEHFPFLKEQCLGYMEENNPLPYIAIGAVFIPWLEARLKEQNANQVSTACTFRGAAAKDGIADPRLNELIGVELGEWLPQVPERDFLLSHFGPDTKKTCHYHIVRLPGSSLPNH